MKKNESKVWFITGSSRGIGRAIAEAALAQGDRVVATSRSPKDVADLVERHGDRVLRHALDVTSPKAAQEAVRASVAAFGRIDVVVNNAGYANTGAIEDIPIEDFRAQVETNFFGAVNVTRAALPVLREQRGGLVLQISSIGGRRGGTPGLAAYQASKFALEGFSEVLAAEVRSFGVRVVIVEPGGFLTDWAGASMTMHPVSSAYEPSVGAFAKLVRGNQAASQGDPKKAAAALLGIADVAEPPLRLLLGTDALFFAKLSETERRRDDERWRAISASTDRDGIDDFANSDIAKMFAGA